MEIEEVRKLTPLKRYMYWIRERESIRLKKEAGKPKPWTDDEILQTYKFTNVRRMDDKVSRWLLENWYEPNYGHPNILRAVALARFLNRIETLEHIGFPKTWRPDAVKIKLRAYRDAGNKVFNGAYMVRGNNGVDKIESVVDFNVTPIKDVELDLDSMERSHRSLQASYGLGSFMAGQIVADLRWAMNQGWDDKDHWAPIGPGSMKGMNCIQERDPKAPLRQERFLEELQDVMEQCRRALPESITSRMEAMDYQNCCCEFSKYTRTLEGSGRPKQLYPGRV